MLSNRRKEKRRQQCLCHFGEDDIVVGNIRLNSVHVLPDGSWKPNQEVSFYLDDGEDIYFLTIRNNEAGTITLFGMTEVRDITDVVIQVPMKGNTLRNLQHIINIFAAFPYRQEIRTGTYQIFPFL